MRYYDVHYHYKKAKHRSFLIRVKAINEEDAKRIAYNKIDNRIYELS